jgi:hypothetical protein
MIPMPWLVFDTFVPWWLHQSTEKWNWLYCPWNSVCCSDYGNSYFDDTCDNLLVVLILG